MSNSESKPLGLELLKSLVAGGAVAIRGKAFLEPAGGPGDKVFPPTHSVDEREPRAGSKYVVEQRRLPGGQVEHCVLLDSVQSQANRMEEALEGLWGDRKVTRPVIAVNFAEVAPKVGRVTSLSAPHRVADAILRDSLLAGTFFRVSDVGRSFTDATPRNAAPSLQGLPNRARLRPVG
jgi:CRISPR-associated protein Csb1